VKKETISKLIFFETYLKGTQYGPFVERVRILLDEGQERAAEEVMAFLPTEKDLLESIMEKMKDKPAYKTLKRGLKKNANDTAFAKGLFSLGTHILIECEKGNTEYRMLLPTLYSRIGSLLKDI